jgi:hypothetical protein
MRLPVPTAAVALERVGGKHQNSLHSLLIHTTIVFNMAPIARTDNDALAASAAAMVTR